MNQTEFTHMNQIHWNKLHETDIRINRRLMKYFADPDYGHYMEFAWDEFTLGEIDFDPESHHMQTFIPWFFHEWKPPSAKKDGKTLAMEYFDTFGQRFSDLERSYILSNHGVPYSFYEVMECNPGKGYHLKDVFLGTEIDVEEHSGSEHVRSGELMFCRVITVDNLSILNGSCSIAIPPRFMAQVIVLRSDMKKRNKSITQKTLISWQKEIHLLYWHIFKFVTEPPKLVNTEGDPFEYHTILFEIESPSYAFEQLKSLCMNMDAKEILEDAELDSEGRVRNVEFDWTIKGNPVHKSWSNTILGNIRIDGNTLTVEVNSRNRADRIKKEISNRLGKNAVYRSTNAKSFEELKKTDPSSGKASRSKKRDLPDPYEIPEIREMLRKEIDEKWKEWIDTKIPLLGGMTPRQAVKCEDGKEGLKALLRDFELSDERNDPLHSQKEYIDLARKELGLE